MPEHAETARRKAVILAPPRDAVAPAYPDDRNAVPVFLGCDDKFFPHALTAIASLMRNASPKTNYDLFIVQSGVPPEKLDAAAAWMERRPNAVLRFIDIDPCIASARDTLPVTKEYSVAVFFRIFAPLLFPEHGRIVYLDSDIVVLGDVAELHRFNLGGMEVGAIRDLATTLEARRSDTIADFWRTRLGKEPGENYFNSGVLLMDLEQMRRRDTLGRCLARAGEITGTALPDQDLLNAVLNGGIRPLPAVWNCFDWMADRFEESPNFRFVRTVPEFLKETRKARHGVKILHFVEKKPWTTEYRGKFAEKYWEYAAETPFHGQILDGLRAECTPAKMLWRRFVLWFQEKHYRVKKHFVREENRKKYRARARNIRWMRKALRRQLALIDGLLPQKIEEDGDGYGTL